jgi:triacylglycerol lipase
MLAWLQRGLVMGLTILALAVGTLLLRAGAPPWTAALAAIAAFNVHALFLAVEFAILARVEPGAGVPHPRTSALLAAWWGEVWVGLQTFCWRQPFRARSWPDRAVSVQHGRHGLLLVHGFVCNRGIWNPLMQRLAAAEIAYIAVNLEPVFDSIDRYVPIIEEGLRQLEALGGAKPIIVAHSMGGLAVRAWLREHRSEHRVHRIVTIATPHRGTWLARFGLTPNARQMKPDSHWLQALAADETPRRRALFTCFFGHCDNIVFPASMAMLADADNRHVPGIAHVHLAVHTSVIDEVMALSAPDAAASASQPDR